MFFKQNAISGDGKASLSSLSPTRVYLLKRSPVTFSYSLLAQHRALPVSMHQWKQFFLWTALGNYAHYCVPTAKLKDTVSGALLHVGLCPHHSILGSGGCVLWWLLCGLGGEFEGRKVCIYPHKPHKALPQFRAVHKITQSRKQASLEHAFCHTVPSTIHCYRQSFLLQLDPLSVCSTDFPLHKEITVTNSL